MAEITNINQKVEKEVKEKKEPIIVDKLELSDGEMYLGKLSDQDKFQVLCRHLTLIEQIAQAGVNGQNLLLANIFYVLKAMAEKQGINVDKILEK